MAARLMTYNVQFLPNVPIIESPTLTDPVIRAKKIAASLLALPPLERPDVIAFNEVFEEEPREVLFTELAPVWTNVVPKLGEDEIPVPGDSGLMLFSRFPLLPLPLALHPKPAIGGGQYVFARYPHHVGMDSFVKKGIGMVLVGAPGLRPFLVLFSHLQAFYDFEDEHAATRAHQFQSVETLLTLGFGTNRAAWPAAVFMGDLNVRGDPGMVSDEWAKTFTLGTGLMATHFLDGWRSFMGRPGGLPPADPGPTSVALEANQSFPAGTQARLDYICFGPQGPLPRILVPHHMLTRFRSLSDHWSLEAIVNVESAFCDPARARQASAIVAGDSGLQAITGLAVRHPGAYQWVFVSDPGTYTIFPPEQPPVNIDLFAQEDLSRPLVPVGTSSADDLDVPALDEDLKNGGRLGRNGTIFAPEGPFFIRIRAVNPLFIGPVSVGVFRHTGGTRGTAIVLHTHAAPLDPLLPAGQPLPPNDQYWFRASIGSALSAKVHTSRFTLDNATGGDAIWTLLDKDGVPIPEQVTGGNGPTLELSYDVVGPETVHVVLQRSSFAQTAFTVRWRTGLTFLLGASNLGPMGLWCEDETGWDAWGSDEAMLRLYADGMSAPYYIMFWNDANTGWQMPLSAGSAALVAPPGAVVDVGFVEGVRVTLHETGDVGDDPPAEVVIGPLADGDPAVMPQDQLLYVQSGRYRLKYTLGRKP
jgi:hypothetical protein